MVKYSSDRVFMSGVYRGSVIPQNCVGNLAGFMLGTLYPQNGTLDRMIAWAIVDTYSAINDFIYDNVTGLVSISGFDAHIVVG